MKKSIYVVNHMVYDRDYVMWPGFLPPLKYSTSEYAGELRGEAEGWDAFLVLPVCFCFLYRKAILSDLRGFRFKRAWRRSISGFIRYLQDLKGSGT